MTTQLIWSPPCEATQLFWSNSYETQLIWGYAWMWTPLWSYAYETTQLILTKQHNGFYVAAQWIWSSAIEAAHFIWSCAYEARQWT